MKRIRLIHLYSADQVPRWHLIILLLEKYLNGFPGFNPESPESMRGLAAHVEAMIQNQPAPPIPASVIDAIQATAESIPDLQKRLEYVSRFPFEPALRAQLLTSLLRAYLPAQLKPEGSLLREMIAILEQAIDNGNGVPGNDRLGQLDVDTQHVSAVKKVMLRIADEACPWLWPRPNLEFRTLKEGLVPFTPTCEPELIHVRKCWCGCWVREDALRCPFCGAPAPTAGPFSKAWIRNVQVINQLNPQQRQPIGPPIIPPDADREVLLAGLEPGFQAVSQLDKFSGVEPDDVLKEREQEDHETEWRGDAGQLN